MEKERMATTATRQAGKCMQTHSRIEEQWYERKQKYYSDDIVIAPASRRNIQCEKRFWKQ